MPPAIAAKRLIDERWIRDEMSLPINLTVGAGDDETRTEIIEIVLPLLIEAGRSGFPLKPLIEAMNSEKNPVHPSER